MLNAGKINVEQLSQQFWANYRAYKKANKISSKHIEYISDTPESTTNRVISDDDPDPRFKSVIGMVFGCNCSFDELFGIKKVTDETGVLISTELIENYKKQLEDKDREILFLKELVGEFKNIVHNMQDNCKAHQNQLANK